MAVTCDEDVTTCRLFVRHIASDTIAELNSLSSQNVHLNEHH
jgi:hypothetical protein